jgi:hypothetical protein
MGDGKLVSPKAVSNGLVLVALIALAYYLFSSSMAAAPAYFPPEGRPVSPEFAKCITDSGAVLYGSNRCSHCTAQKDLFGETIEEIEFIDCDANRDICSLAGISAYPTWVIGGQKYVGTQPLEKIADLTGCSLSA